MSVDDFTSKAAMAAQHAVYPRPRLKVAPTDDSVHFNTIRIPLIPVACWRLNDPGFGFDSSFVAPAFRDELAALSGIVAANHGCVGALFAHCDPAGSDALNKTLGDRRAIAVYALLTRQPDLWASLYDDPQVGDTWGKPAIQTMLASITGRSTDDHGNPADPATTPYYGGAIDGDYGRGTTAAVKAFQTDCGLTPDGRAGHQTRKVLFGAYLDWLCTSPDAAPAEDSDAQQPSPPPAPFRMHRSDFLGGTGVQPGDLPKMSLQSCGKFNPIVLLPSSEMNLSDTTSRNADDAPNRRVLMFFFAKGTKVEQSVWPCPKVKELGGACHGAFWPNGDQQRKNGHTKRLYKDTRDTMACRFYDRFARRSPCEGSMTAGILRLWLHDHLGQRMGANAGSSDPVEQSFGAPYRLVIGPQQVRTGYADDKGLLVETNLVVHRECRLQWGKRPDADAASPPDDDDGASAYFLYDEKIFLDTTGTGPDKVPRQLLNLGYVGNEDRQRTAFANDYGGSDDDLIGQVHATGKDKPMLVEDDA